MAGCICTATRQPHLLPIQTLQHAQPSPLTQPWMWRLHSSPGGGCCCTRLLTQAEYPVPAVVLQLLHTARLPARLHAAVVSGLHAVRRVFVLLSPAYHEACTVYCCSISFSGGLFHCTLPREVYASSTSGGYWWGTCTCITGQTAHPSMQDGTKRPTGKFQPMESWGCEVQMQWQIECCRCELYQTVSGREQYCQRCLWWRSTGAPHRLVRHYGSDVSHAAAWHHLDT